MEPGQQERESLIREIFRDMIALGREIVGQRRTPHSAIGVSEAQGMALHFIANVDGLGIRQIADTMRVTSSAATQFVDSLVRAGLLVRETDPDDRRSVRVSLTDEGRNRLEELQRVKLAGIAQVLSFLSDEELRTFRDLLRKIINGQTRQREGQREPDH